MNLTRTLAALLATGAAPLAARAQAPVVELSAVPEYAVVAPGAAFRVAVRLQIPDGWHIYWTNPGPSGLATTLSWRVPAGITGGGTDWPYPETDDAAEPTNVYRGNVVLFSSFTAAPGSSGAVELVGTLKWGICRVVCVQQSREVTVPLRVRPGAVARTPAWAQAEAATRFLPMRERGATFAAAAQGDSVRLTITGLKAGPGPGSWATYFAGQPGRRSFVVPVRPAAGGITITLPRAAAGDSASNLAGVLVAAHARGTPPPVRAIAVEVPVTK